MHPVLPAVSLAISTSTAGREYRIALGICIGRRRLFLGFLGRGGSRASRRVLAAAQRRRRLTTLGLEEVVPLLPGELAGGFGGLIICAAFCGSGLAGAPGEGGKQTATTEHNNYP